MSAKSWLSGPSRKAAVIRHLPGALVAIDRTAMILWASDSVAALGYDADELVGRSGFDLIAPEDAETAATALLRAMDGDGVKEPWPLRIVDTHGQSRWVEMTPSNLLDDPGIGAILIGIRALDDKSAVAEEARTIEELFRRAFDDAPIGMALVGPNGRFARVNRALCELLQRPVGEVVGADGRSLTHPDDIEVERPLVDELLAGERRSYELDKRFVRPDGSIVWTSVGVSLVRTSAGEPERFVVNVQDITHRQASEADLAHRATHDPTTGLANRALFDDRLQIALARGRRVTTSVGVLCCVLPGDDGDRAELAARLQEAVRPGDTVAPSGPDRYLVLCEDLVTDGDLDAIAARVTRAAARPVQIGKAMSSGRESAAELVGRAEAAAG